MPGKFIGLGLPLLVTILFMFALRPFAREVGLIDKPGGRKTHVGEIPVIGGLAMMAGLLVGSIYSYSSFAGYPYLIGALIVLVFVGALDDRFDLPASVRFIGQISATLLMVGGADIEVVHIGRVFFGGAFELGILSLPFTILIVLTAVNAFNMFDGSDGVAAVQALIALVFIGFACVMAGQTQPIPFIVSLAGCILGFLIFNWPSKRTINVRTFMGDAGSTMLGFSLAWLSVQVSQGSEPVFTPVVALWIFALPVFDLFSSMVRRMLRGQSPFHADSEHLHHVLRRAGMGSRRVAQMILLAASVLAALGLGGYYLQIPDGVLFAAWLFLGVVYHVIFGSGLVIARRTQPREGDALATGKYWTLWKQRRRKNVAEVADRG